MAATAAMTWAGREAGVWGNSRQAGAGVGWSAGHMASCSKSMCRPRHFQDQVVVHQTESKHKGCIASVHAQTAALATSLFPAVPSTHLRALLAAQQHSQRLPRPHTNALVGRCRRCCAGRCQAPPRVTPSTARGSTHLVPTPRRLHTHQTVHSKHTSCSAMHARMYTLPLSGLPSMK